MKYTENMTFEEASKALIDEPEDELLPDEELPEPDELPDEEPDDELSLESTCTL